MQYYYSKPLNVYSNQYMAPEINRENNLITWYNVIIVESPLPPPYILMPTFRQINQIAYDQYWTCSI